MPYNQRRSNGGCLNTFFVRGSKLLNVEPSETTNQKIGMIFFVFSLPVILLFVIILTGSVFGGVLGTSEDINPPSPSGSTPTEQPDRDQSFLTLSSGVTRNAFFGNPFFCSEVTLEVISRTRSGASVYLITDTPPLTDRNNFTIRSDNFVRGYHVWNYYFYSGSVTISLDIPCATSSGNFSLFKGGAA